MSAWLFPDDVLFFQRLLKAEKLYGGALDGQWGPRTERGALEFEARSDRLRDEFGGFDSRSEGCIRTLALRAQSEARRFLAKVLGAGLRARIISGSRTYEEQNRLFRQGRYGNPGPVVTHARGGASNHNFGVAWDLGLFTKAGGYVTDPAAYDDPATVGLSPGLEWGGQWRKFPDKPHYQLGTGLTLAGLRAKFEAGESPIGLA